MTGVPTTLHLGPLTFHLYGIGLALAGYVAYLYSERRLRQAGLSQAPFARFTALILGFALLGARGANIATNWSYYSGHPGRWIAVWQGGLASFGALGIALPAALWGLRRWWPGVSLGVFSDALVHALVAGWALGRVLGPQFMVAGGGHETTSWIGLHYAGQVGKRVPVPLIQGAEDGTLWLILRWLEGHWTRRRVGGLAGVAMVVWGLARAYDEHYLLGQNSHSGSVGVQVAALVLALAGVATLLRARLPVSPPARVLDASGETSESR